MRFQYMLVVEDANAIQELSLDVQIKAGLRSVRVQAKNSDEDFKKVSLIACTETKVSERNLEIIQQIREVPRVYFESSPSDQPREGLAIPQSYESFVGTLIQDLHGASMKAWKLLLWRFNVTTGSRYITGRGFQVQIEDTWHVLPARGSAYGFARETLPGPNKDLSVLESLADSIDEPPLAFDLLHEARELSSRNPRAALAIGIVALEVGFKRMVSELIPVNEWLVENAPSPPVERMMREWMKSLPVRLTIDGEVKVPSERIMKNLKKGILLRNKLAHTGAAKVTTPSVDNLLNDISDCLRIFDYYLGYQWAAKYLEIETLDELDFPEWREFLDEHVRPNLRKKIGT